MGNLYLLGGQPASGKSTIAQQYIKDHPNTVWVSRDAIRFALLGDGDYYFERENDVYRQFIEEICSNLDKGYDVLADQTNLNTKSRSKLLRAIDFKQGKYDNLYCIWVNTSLQTSLKRNEERSGRAKVPESALINMYNRMTKPSTSEGFNEIFIVNGE